MRGAHDDLVDHHHRHRGAAHRVDGNRLRVAGAADHHPLVGAHAVVPGAEGVQLLFRDADQQDRFVVFEDVGVADNRLRIEDHLQVDRLAGVGRDVGDAEGLEGVAEGFLALAQAAYAVVAFGVADPLDRGNTWAMRRRSNSLSSAPWAARPTSRSIQAKTHRHDPAEKRRARIGSIYYWLPAKKGRRAAVGSAPGGGIASVAGC